MARVCWWYLMAGIQVWCLTISDVHGLKHCGETVAVADWIDDFSTLEEACRRHGDLEQLMTVKHSFFPMAEQPNITDVILQLLVLATFARVLGMYKRLVLKLMVEQATLLDIEDILQTVALTNLCTGIFLRWVQKHQYFSYWVYLIWCCVTSRGSKGYQLMPGICWVPTPWSIGLPL